MYICKLIYVCTLCHYWSKARITPKSWFKRKSFFPQILRLISLFTRLEGGISWVQWALSTCLYSLGFIKVRFDPSTRYKDSLHQLWCRMLIQLLSYYWCCVVFTTRPESWPSADTTTQFIIIGVIIGVGFATVCPDQAYCLVILNQLSRYIKQAVYSQTNHNSVPWQTIDSVDILREIL